MPRCRPLIMLDVARLILRARINTCLCLCSRLLDLKMAASACNSEVDGWVRVLARAMPNAKQVAPCLL